MATYFGELIEKPSRAFWIEEYDSEDDLRLEVSCRKLQITKLSDTSNADRKDKLFIVVCGPLTEGFVESCIVEGKCVAEIEENDNSHARKRKPKSTIRRLTNEVSCCVCSVHLDITQAFEFTETLSPWMKNSEQIIVLTSSHLSEYYGQGIENGQDMLVRALKTDCYNSPVLSTILEQPNTMKGVPAAILTWCQMSKIPAIAYTCFTRSFETDSSTVKPFQDIISTLPYKLLKEKPDFRRKIYSGHEVSSNVYM